MSNHLRMTNSFFRLDTNYLPIRLDTKWLLIGQYWRQWCCPWLNLKLFKGRHRNSNMEFLNIAQIFEHCPNCFNIVQRTFDSKVLFLYPVLFLCSLDPKKYFFQPFFVFSLLLPFLMLKNAFKKYPPQNRTNVQIKGGGVKGLLNNVKKNCTFLSCRLP